MRYQCATCDSATHCKMTEKKTHILEIIRVLQYQPEDASNTTTTETDKNSIRTWSNKSVTVQETDTALVLRKHILWWQEHPTPEICHFLKWQMSLKCCGLKWPLIEWRHDVMKRLKIPLWRSEDLDMSHIYNNTTIVDGGLDSVAKQ